MQFRCIQGLQSLNMIKRDLEKKIINRFGTGKAILLIGPRQVGKTILFNKLLERKEYLFLNGDDPTVRKLISKPNSEQFKNIIGNHKIVFIDEAGKTTGFEIKWNAKSKVKILEPLQKPTRQRCKLLLRKTLERF